jgi:5-methylcytosine-specific restriction endonuclease McrA
MPEIKQAKTNGGRVALVRQIRKLDEYEQWKRAVFIRDRFTCQQCGRRNGRKRVIEADHIKSVSEILTEYRLKSIEDALGCSFLWDSSNGRTLCHSCHEQTASYPKNFIRKKTEKRNVKHH